MKTETLTTGVVALRNQQQPQLNDDENITLFDYLFYTELEKLAKREREKAKKRCIDIANKPDDVEGVLFETHRYRLSLSIARPSEKFDLDTFLNSLVETYPDIMKHQVREIAAASVVPGTTFRRTYKVEEISD